jgi:hypothetical protein
METIHEQLHLDKCSFVYQKNVDTPKIFIWTIHILLDKVAKYTDG